MGFHPLRLGFLGGALAVALLSCAGLMTGSGTSVENVLLHHLGYSPQVAPPGVQLKTAADSQTPLTVAEWFRPLRFQRPTKTRVINSGFGPRGNRHHDGIDLRASEGTPLYAAAEGQVIYVGDGISGYGLTVILLHANKFSTLYAHASQVRVKRYQKIERGEAIAYAGETGNATSPHLHFELRHGLIALDPTKYIPGL